MIFDDDVFYALKPETVPKSQELWHGWYTGMTNPLALLGLLGYYYTVFRPKFMESFSSLVERGGTDIYLIVTLLILTFAIGWRLVQSLHLAKKDYTQLVFGFGDVLTLLFFIFFTSGAAIMYYPDHPQAIILVYACLCSVGFWHFMGLAKRRIAEDSKLYDIPIEVRIQTVNYWVFGILAVNFGTAFLVMQIAPSLDRIWICLILLPVLPTIIINILHSHELTYWPKLIINNKYLAPDKIAKRLEATVGVDDDILKKRSVLMALKDYEVSYRSLSICRAKQRDISFLLGLYLRDFEYALDGIFKGLGGPNSDLMDKLLRSSFGLGFLGYLRFYVIEIEGKAVGMIMPEFRSAPILYTALDYLTVGRLLIRQSGFAGLRTVLGNLKALKALQPTPESKELRLNYVAIADTEKLKGTAARVITLLQQAYVHSITNGFQAQKITAFVRDGNVGSIALFEKAGFVREDIDADPSVDPTRGNGNGLILFACTEKQAEKAAAPPKPTKPRVKKQKIELLAASDANVDPLAGTIATTTPVNGGRRRKPRSAGDVPMPPSGENV